MPRKPKTPKNPATAKPKLGRPPKPPPKLADIQAKSKAGKPLTPREKLVLKEFLETLNKDKPALELMPTSKFHLKTALATIDQEIYAAYMIEMKSGKGIARIQAADRLREWADDLGVHDDEHEDDIISFLPVGVDRSGNVIPMKKPS